MLLPLLVLYIVVAGFYRWRAVCPLAAFGELGRGLPRRFQRRVPTWLERGHIVVPFLFLASMLVVRHVATNGDGAWIAGLLIALAIGAIATNAIFTGKTWCNFVCPVGFIERIYTDSARLLPARANSQCFRCTACKRSCPDIDQENNYWRELRNRGRRFATYAFPGVVFAFYFYFWLRAGEWEAYFDGRWTAQKFGATLVAGPGFFFAPRVPAWVAATATIAALAVVSFTLFAVIEAAIRGLVPDRDRRRHLVLSFAAFSAFSIFYVYAGAPTLRRIPGATRVFAFATPALAMLVLSRRWGRSRDAFIRDRVAARLTRKWPFAGEPPADPIEAYARVQATEQAREQLLAGYVQTLRDVLADGLVDEGEVRMLAEIRKQFGITPREHEQVVARLAEEERRLISSGRFATVEERLQLESYRAALTEAIRHGAPPAEIEELQREFGIRDEDHAAVLARIRSASGPLLERARREIEVAAARRSDREALAPYRERGEGLQLLDFLLARAEQASLSRAFDVLESIGDRDRCAVLRPRLSSRDPETRKRAFAGLGDACPAAVDLLPLLDRFVSEPQVPPEVSAESPLVPLLERLVGDADPFVRSAAVWGLGALRPGSPKLLEIARADPDPLVTEAAAAGLVVDEDPARAADNFTGRTRIARMQFLRGVPLFAELEPDDLLDLAELARQEELAPGQVLCEQDRVDSGDLFVVLAGRAVVEVRTGRSGPSTEVAELGSGEVVGELSILDGSPRSATVRAKDPLRVLRIPAQAFRERLLPRGRFSRALLLTLTARLRALTERLSSAPVAGPPGGRG